ncbi:hypothetical protein D9613_004207 [Agrocybe pediades]|uniref:nicotinamidase n=1 Tax=Agrocybe pediades TaxID=84607 RepID=A0A8H4VJ89_9AGAR|nr:hypothetical protein D9613_004207 [Agrocybe pediades]KAF9567824.1 pyrazinamidase/nicotinamidase [Agrocybe pediades]
MSDILSQISDTSPPTMAPGEVVPALIVIDMQNDFVYGSLAVPGGESIIDPINDLLKLPFATKIATRDFHPDNHVSFARTHNQRDFEKKTIYHPEDHLEKQGIQQVLWPVHCVAYTGGADFVPGLNSMEFEAVIHKGTHPRIESYSAFRDIWGKGETDLPAILQDRGVTDIYFCGLAGDYCVKYTAIDAMQYGYKTWLVTDAIKSISNEETWLDTADAKGIHSTTVEELMKKMLSDTDRLRMHIN